MPKAVSTQVSERIAGNVRNQRLARGWSRQELSMQLHDHRCDMHPHGFGMSAAVINAIENGVPPQHGHPARTRPVTSDELYVFSEVLRSTVRELMG